MFQPVDNRITVVLLLLWFYLSHVCLSYPEGSPSCISRPGHGAAKEAVKLEVVKVAERKWQVSICFQINLCQLGFVLQITMPEEHKGLVISTKFGGN